LLLADAGGRGSRRARFAAWTPFWEDARFSARGLALARIAIGALVIEFALHQRPSFLASGQAAGLGFASDVHLAYATGLVPALSYRAMAGLYLIVAGCGALALLGVITRASLLAASLLLLLALLQDRLAFLNHQHHLIVVTFLLAFVPCAERWSLGRLWSGAAPSTEVTSWAARLLQVMTSFVFLASALSKTKPAWWSGELMIAGQMANADVGVRGGLAIAAGMASPAVWARLALAVEYFLAFAWWSPRTRKIAYVVAVAFHLGVESAFMVGTFSWQMAAVYLIFVAERRRPGDGWREATG
jgi:hypothetical protein